MASILMRETSPPMWDEMISFEKCKENKIRSRKLSARFLIPWRTLAWRNAAEKIPPQQVFIWNHKTMGIFLPGNEETWVMDFDHCLRCVCSIYLSLFSLHSYLRHFSLTPTICSPSLLFPSLPFLSQSQYFCPWILQALRCQKRIWTRTSAMMEMIYSSAWKLPHHRPVGKMSYLSVVLCTNQVNFACHYQNSDEHNCGNSRALCFVWKCYIYVPRLCQWFDG